MDIKITNTEQITATYFTADKDNYKILTSPDDYFGKFHEIYKERLVYVEGSEGDAETGPKTPDFDVVWDYVDCHPECGMPIEAILKYVIVTSQD
jgi:hypothetical protein